MREATHRQQSRRLSHVGHSQVPPVIRHNADAAACDVVATLTEQRGDRLDGNIIVSADAVSVVLLYIADLNALMMPPPASAA